MILFGEDDKNFKIGEPIRKRVTITIPNDINILDVRVEQNGKPFKIVPYETKKNSSEGIRSDVDMIRNLDKIQNELLKMYIDKLNSGEYISLGCSKDNANPFDREDIDFLRGRWVKEKGSSRQIMICKFNTNKKSWIGLVDQWVTPDVLLRDYEFLDGSACGKEI